MTVIDAGSDRVVGQVGVNHVPTAITVTDTTCGCPTNASSTIDRVDPAKLTARRLHPVGHLLRDGRHVVA